MKALQQNTEKENALFSSIAHYMQQNSVGQHRKKSLDLLQAAGLPSRRVEAWHYTDLRRFLEKFPGVFIEAKEKTKAVELPPLFSNAFVFTTTSAGAAVSELSSSLEKGASFAVMNSPLLQPYEEEAGKSALHLGGASDVGGHANYALWQAGASLVIEEGGKLTRPIEWQNSGASHTGLYVELQKNSQATIIERQSAAGAGAPCFKTSQAHVKLGENAELTWVILQDAEDMVLDLAQFRAVLNKSAKLTLFVVQKGASLLRREIKVDLCGEGADFQLRGINLLSGKTHSDITMQVRHLVEETSSREIIRNIAKDTAQGVFQGFIGVDQVAQKTDAKMACNTLLLSEDASFFMKPELEIFADDVACGHGATIAQLNPEQLFYLKSRGISDNDARQLLLVAFVAELLQDIPAEEMQKVLYSWLHDYLLVYAA